MGLENTTGTNRVGQGSEKASSNNVIHTSCALKPTAECRPHWESPKTLEKEQKIGNLNGEIQERQEASGR